MPTTMIVGGNRGIGFELVRQLHLRDHRVIATCRKSSAALDALTTSTEGKHPVQLEAGVDVTKDDSVAALAERLKDRKLNELIVSAGVLRQESLDNLDFDSIRFQFEVNTLGPLRVIAGVRHLMRDGGKIGIMTSRMGSITDNTSGGSYGYRISKCAVNIVGVSLAHDLRDREISVVMLHPGFVKTEMTGGRGHLEPEESARLLLDRFADLDLDASGSFWHADGEELPW